MEGVEVRGELERGRHKADKTRKEQQQVDNSLHQNQQQYKRLSARSRSRSMLSKSNAESLNKFGLIGGTEPDQKSVKSRKVKYHIWNNLEYSFTFFHRIPTTIALMKIPMEKV